MFERARRARPKKERFSLSVHPLFFLYGLFYLARGELFLFAAGTVCAVMHECGHAWYAARLGFRLNRLCLLPSGAVVTGDLAGISLSDEIRLALAGPAINFVCALLFFALWWLAPEAYAYTDAAAYASASLCFVNFLPAYPLDGGRVLYCIIAKKKGERSARRGMVAAGLITAAALTAVFAVSCFYRVNVSPLFVALFVLSATFGKNECRYARIRYDLSGELARGMEVKRIALAQRCSVKKALSYLERGRYLELSVYDEGGRLVGRLGQAEFCALVEQADLYRPLSDYLADFSQEDPKKAEKRALF